MTKKEIQKPSFIEKMDKKVELILRKKYPNNLRELREKNGLSQEVFAQLAEVSTMTISRAENAETVLKLEGLVRVALASGESIDELLGIKTEHEDLEGYLKVYSRNIADIKSYGNLRIKNGKAEWRKKKVITYYETA